MINLCCSNCSEYGQDSELITLTLNQFEDCWSDEAFIQEQINEFENPLAPYGLWEKFKKSIEEEGIVNPLDVEYNEETEKYILKIGRHRLVAGLLAGLTEFPCRIYRKFEIDAVKYELQDNKLVCPKCGDIYKENFEEIAVVDARVWLTLIPAE